MLSRTKKLAAVCSLAGAAVLGTGFGVHAAHASTSHPAATTDTDDSLTPKNTKVNVTVKTGTAVSILVNSPLGSITATCTALNASFTTPASGLKTQLAAPPTITGCTDSLGGTDTINTSGTWKFAETDKAGDESLAEPNATGDGVSITVPVDAATLQSTALPGCTLTLNPSVVSKLKGAYNDAGGAKFTNANPGVVSPGAGCPQGTYTEALTAALHLSVKVHDVS